MRQFWCQLKSQIPFLTRARALGLLTSERPATLPSFTTHEKLNTKSRGSSFSLKCIFKLFNSGIPNQELQLLGCRWYFRWTAVCRCRAARFPFAGNMICENASTMERFYVFNLFSTSVNRMKFLALFSSCKRNDFSKSWLQNIGTAPLKVHV